MSLLSKVKAAITQPIRQHKIKKVGQALGVLSKKSVFDFGKYKGITVKAVIEQNPSYILWLLDNTSVTFTEKVIKSAREAKLKQDSQRVHRVFSRGGYRDLDDYDYDQWNFDCPGPWGDGV